MNPGSLRGLGRAQRELQEKEDELQRLELILEARLSASFRAGERAGWDLAVKTIEARAVELWANRQENEAKALRALADGLKEHPKRTELGKAEDDAKVQVTRLTGEEG